MSAVDTIPYPPKKSGCCLACGQAVYAIVATKAEPGHPLDGHPVRLGPMKDEGTQVEFTLADGSEAAVTFCLEDANALRPEHYAHVWTACLEAQDVRMLAAGRSENERAAAWAALAATYPVGIARKRREAGGGMLTVDRR